MKNFKLKKKNLELSDVPSEAIEQCLEDLEFCERNPDYDVNMDIWHGKTMPFHRACQVCFGGSRLARILDDPSISGTRMLEKMDTRSERKIRATDYFRNGHVRQGLLVFYDGFEGLRVSEVNNFENRFRLKIGNKESIDNFMKWVNLAPSSWTTYEEDPDKFKSCIGRVVKELKEVGL